MIHDLTYYWENIDEEQSSKLKPTSEQKNINDKITQCGFEFTGSPKVKIVRSTKDLNGVIKYADLLEVELTDTEASVVKNVKEDIEGEGGYDGPQLLVTNVLYDDEKNEVYVVAKRAKYSLLRSLGLKKFAEGSPIYSQTFYKTGVLAPFVTQDNETFFVERSRDKFYSVASGFIEADEKGILGNSPDQVVYKTALQEAKEEFLGDRDWVKRIYITGVSFRVTKGGIGTIEFVAPVYLNIDSKTVATLINNNTSKDAKEHTQNSAVVSFETRNIASSTHTLKSGLSGWFLYGPCASSIAVSQGFSTTSVPGVMSDLPIKSLRSNSLAPRPMRSLKFEQRAPKPNSNKRQHYSNKRQH